jgi:cation:H+ antiporter
MRNELIKIAGILFIIIILVLSANNESVNSNIYLNFFQIFIGLIGLLLAADVFSAFSLLLGQRLKLSQFAAGTLIIAIGTSAPELFSSFAAALKNETPIIVGNTYGTVIANTLLGLGAGAIVARNLKISRVVIGSQLPIFVGTVLLSAGMFYDLKITFVESLILLVFLAVYLMHTIKLPGKATVGTGIIRERKNHIHIIIVISILLFSLFGLYYISDAFIEHLIVTSDLLGISSAKLATSVLAIGTSLPEILVAIQLARKKEIDGLFGGIIGSNIFDILGIFGVCGLINPIMIDQSFLIFLLLSLASVLIIIITIAKDRRIELVEGILLLFLFVQFIIIIIEI